MFDLTETGWGTVPESFGQFVACRVSPDGSFLVGLSGAAATALSLEGWDLTARPPARKWAVGPRDTGVRNIDYPAALRISADNRWFTTPEAGEKEGTWKLTLWRNTGPKPEVYGSIECKPLIQLYRAALSPDGRYLAHTPDAASTIVLVDLTGKERHRPDQLSAGEQQRVAVARALVTRPAILFADEPTGNLDYTTGTELLDALWRSCVERGQTIVLVTHDSKAAAYADRVLVMNDGRIRDQIQLGRREVHDTGPLVARLAQLGL